MCLPASTNVWIDESMTTSTAENDMQIGFKSAWKMSYCACFSMCVLSSLKAQAIKPPASKPAAGFPTELEKSTDQGNLCSVVVFLFLQHSFVAVKFSRTQRGLTLWIPKT